MSEATNKVALQGELWGLRPHDWARLQENAFEQLYAEAFTAAGVGPGTRLLDICCGAGLALQRATERGAIVAGLDAAPNLLTIARERVPDAELRVGDLESLPWPDHTFDAVSGFNAFQYAGDRVQGLREARRVVAPGGLVIAGVWGAPEDCDARGYFAAMGRLAPPPPPGTPGPWALSEEGALEKLMESAGLEPQTRGLATGAFIFRNDQEAVDGFFSAGVTQRVIRHCGEMAMRAAILEAVAPYCQSDGGYRLINQFRFVIARA